MFLMPGPLAVPLRTGLPFSFVTGALACIILSVFGNAAMLNMLPWCIFMARVPERAGMIAGPAWLCLKMEVDDQAARQRVRSTRSRPWS